tara:strand:+ start:207 stop:551 length:345 start_codon:yes stop_codon:yes gene_type:complete
MSKIKIFFILFGLFVLYKGYTAFRDFEIGVTNRAVDIKVKSGRDVEGEVIALMMYFGKPLKLKEHLYTSSRTECLNLKENAESSSSAFYKCARVNAKITEGKIVELIEELEVIQ